MTRGTFGKRRAYITAIRGRSSRLLLPTVHSIYVTAEDVDFVPINLSIAINIPWLSTRVEMEWNFTTSILATPR